MKKFPYVEDYLEIINGDRDPNTGKTLGLFNSTPPIIQLARYDVKVLDSMSQNTQAGIALTDKQAELACKIILKYRKQLAAQQIDVSPVETPSFRITLRTIDRSMAIYIDEDHICVKFPYQQKLVEAFKTTAKDSQGRAVWNRDLKLWQLAITEFNINWAYSFAKSHNFTVDPAIELLMNQIIECEKNTFNIRLCKLNDRVVITNAASELTDYINKTIGEISNKNIIELIDNSSILGYDVDPIFENLAVTQSNPRIYNLMINRDSKFDSTNTEAIFQDLIHYANITNRWPIYIYEPNLSNSLLGMAQNIVGKEKVYMAQNKILPDFARIGRQVIVHFTKYQSLWNERIPLLISSNGMLYGGDKQVLLNRAEKIVYLAHDVYNNSSRGVKSIAS